MSLITGTTGIPSAAFIMARVGSNQDQAEAERNRYGYVQTARVASQNGSAVMCEEMTDTRFSTSKGVPQANLLDLVGRELSDHRYVQYSGELQGVTDSALNPIAIQPESLRITLADEDRDRDLVERLRLDLTNDKSDDSINRQLFPLTSKAQTEYSFRVVGLDSKDGREVFHLIFSPKENSPFGLMGDAYIDTRAFQPVNVTTRMAHKVPLAVRTLFGTNLSNLDFSVGYGPQSNGPWLPVYFKAHFGLRILLFFTRDLTMDVRYGAFEAIDSANIDN